MNVGKDIFESDIKKLVVHRIKVTEQIEPDMFDLTIYDDLITILMTLKLVLEDIDKISIVIDLEINKKIKQIKLYGLDY